MPNPDTPAATMGVMTYNILAGGGPRLPAIEQVIRDAGADLIGVQEVLRPDLLARLAEHLEMYHALGRSPSDWHVGILSRWPILDVRTYSDSPMLRSLLDVLVELPDGTRLRFFSTHLSARFNAYRMGEGHRLKELAFVLDILRDVREAGEPHVLVGDFNSVAPGERFQPMQVMRHALSVDAKRKALGHEIHGHPGVDNILPPVMRPLRPLLSVASRNAPLSGLCDTLVSLYMPRSVIGRMLTAGYIDCYAATYPDPGTRAFTCPLPAPGGRIDYIWASPSFAERLVTCDVLTDAPQRPVMGASDHRPLLATFRLGESSPLTNQR